MALIERWVLIFAMPLAQVPNMALAVVLGVLREDLALSYVELGVVVGSFGLARLLTALPAGSLLQRFDPRPTLLVALAASLAAMLMGYLAATGWQLVVSRVAFGAASSVAYAIALPWLLGSATGGSKARVRVMAFMEAAFGVVALGAPLVTGGLAGLLSWRGAFVLGALATVLAFTGIALLTSSSSARQATGHSPHSPSMPLQNTAPAPTGWMSLRVGGRLLLVAHLITLAVFFSRQALLYTLLPVIGADHVGMSPLEVGTAFALLNVVATIVLVVGAWLASRLDSRQFVRLGMLLLLLPLGLLLVGSFMRLFGCFSIPDPYTTLHWARVFRDPSFLASIRNSLVLGLTVGALGTLAYSLLAYVIVRSRFAGRRTLSLLVWLPWAVPGILLGVALLWLMLTVPGLTVVYGTIGALMLALAIQNMPLGTQMMQTAFGQVGAELEQASRVCGASWVTTYRRIMLPLVAPMLVSIAVLTFVAVLRDISTTVLLATATTRPLSLLVLEFARGSNLESASVVGVLLSALSVGVALIARRMGVRLRSEAV